MSSPPFAARMNRRKPIVSTQTSAQQFRQAGQLYQAARFAEALALLEPLERAYPTNKEICYSMALCLEQLGRKVEALELCGRLIAQFQDSRAQEMQTRLSSGSGFSDLNLPDLSIDLDFSRPKSAIPSAPASPAPKPAAKAAPAPAGPKVSGDRIVSVDVLRGFVMMFIIGGGEYSRAFLSIDREGFWGFLGNQLEHPGWEGLRFFDLIFPTFLFIIGISLVFSLDKLVGQADKTDAYKRIFKRFAILFFLGVLCDQGMNEITEENVLCGVLQRLALCYLAASLLFLNLEWKALAGILVGVLVGYWILFTMVPVPGVGVSIAEEGMCWPYFIDARIPPYYDTDPEGFATTIPAVCTCLLGVLTGIFLRDNDLSEAEVAKRLAGAGLALLVTGYVFWYVLHCPVIKRAWTTSYVLCAGGYSLLFLSLLYFIIDVKEWQGPWMQPFLWLGMNPLIVYVGNESKAVNFEGMARMFVGGPVAQAFGPYGNLLVACAGLAITLWFMRYLYEREIFLRA